MLEVFSAQSFAFEAVMFRGSGASGTEPVPHGAPHAAFQARLAAVT